MDHIDKTFDLRGLNSLKAKRPKLSGENLDAVCDVSTSISPFTNCDGVLVDSSSYDHASGDSGSGNEGMVISQTELTCDMGYGSLSAHPDDLGDAAGDVTEHTSQFGPMSQWNRSPTDENDELEDLLYNFGNYFERQLEAELSSFQEKMHDLLMTQQQHIRRIVYKCNPQPLIPTLPDERLKVNTEMVGNSTARAQVGTASSSSGELPRVSYADTSLNYTVRKREAQDGLTGKQLLELMRLSAACTTVLSKPQFLTGTSKPT